MSFADVDASKIPAWIPISPTLLADALWIEGKWQAALLVEGLPDPNPLPTLVLFPRLAAAADRLREWTNK